ncbi:S-formylglutathione hydrolase [Allocatelliglobosispora scoriae]|uniref:S-formylglutathione hydrolase n=1 Tax=Allocatelliglobosispora scoriae TaxID=643052 RepID=A0A841BY85_9ACTN|nr:alpha/beta hydrolase-fold protein [Allocatelliglobosispora scoriae]MBB5874117.1 S-formylglutathione hydrolase [Allocatelliglobosispora scoriae]
MESSLTRDTLHHPAVTGEVPFAVLTPAEWTTAEKLPLIVVLHGANSSCELLAMLQPLIEGLWADDSLPRSVVACASTPTVGGFYVDAPGGAWETLVAEVLPQVVVERFHTDPARASLVGASMGGYGALKIAFADPGRWQAVAAVAPALLPGLSPEAVLPRNTLGVLADLVTRMAGGGADERRYAENHVLHRLHAHADAIRASGLPILLRCGDRDVFNMHDGTEQLHRALWDLDIGHDYHLVLGADHIGPEAMAAQRAAFAFVGAAQRAQAGRDRTPADRALEAAWHEWSARGRQGSPPDLDAFGVTGPVAVRVLLEAELAEAARRDPTAARRYGQVAPE